MGFAGIPENNSSERNGSTLQPVAPRATASRNSSPYSSPPPQFPVIPAEVRDDALRVLRVLRRADGPAVADQEIVDVPPQASSGGKRATRSRSMMSGGFVLSVNPSLFETRRTWVSTAMPTLMSNAWERMMFAVFLRHRGGGTATPPSSAGPRRRTRRRSSSPPRRYGAPSCGETRSS